MKMIKICDNYEMIIFRQISNAEDKVGAGLFSLTIHSENQNYALKIFVDFKENHETETMVLNVYNQLEEVSRETYIIEDRLIEEKDIIMFLSNFNTDAYIDERTKEI